MNPDMFPKNLNDIYKKSLEEIEKTKFKEIINEVFEKEWIEPLSDELRSARDCPICNRNHASGECDVERIEAEKMAVAKAQKCREFEEHGADALREPKAKVKRSLRKIQWRDP